MEIPSTPVLLSPGLCTAAKNVEPTAKPSSYLTTKLLDHNLLRLRTDSAMIALCSDRNHVFSLRKRWRVIVKRPVSANHRHFFTVHHHPSVGVRFATH